MSLRLDAIVKIAPKVSTAADIGCDHGKAGTALLNIGKAQFVIFSDISAKSLEKTWKLVNTVGLSDRASLRVGNGFEVLGKGEADAAIIAGMGGELIAGILEEGKQNAPDVLILSCNTKPEVLRQKLCGSGYMIEDEDMVLEDGRFYPIILARKGNSRVLGDMELELGPILMKKRHEALVSLLNVKINKAIGSRARVEMFGTPKAKQRLGELDIKIDMYKEVKEWLLR